MPERVTYKDSLTAPVVVVAGIVLICFFTAAIALAAELGGVSSSTTPVITSVLSTLGVAVVGLTALAKAEKVDKKTDAVNDKVDGHITRLTNIAAAAAAATGDPKVVADAREAERIAADVITPPPSSSGGAPA
jgi:uncharacterized membrane protein AbrB (regulator of aidB expression)